MPGDGRTGSSSGIACTAYSLFDLSQKTRQIIMLISKAAEKWNEWKNPTCGVTSADSSFLNVHLKSTPVICDRFQDDPIAL
ncbi:hypothetical protein J2W17_006094 [Pseudomonas lini]|jgi:hypothetical protein|nr:hypothetical protein [Pseudomonas lini]